MSQTPTGPFRAFEPQGGERAGPDKAFLDALFDEVMERLEGGERVLVDELLRGRETLRAEVERVIELAERVAVVRPAGRPDVPGYSILGELGKGGMGAVYLARQESLGGRPVALKVLPRGFGMSVASRERFLLEARAVARLRHPNIVAIHDVVDSGEVSAFAMEWVEGSSLARLIESIRESGGDAASVRVSRLLEGAIAGEKGVDEVWALYVARVGIAMARALEAVHGAGMLHRDVKPSNILIRPSGEALLSDFGLVREEGSGGHTISGQFVGTLAYAAPEQLRGERALDARTDVYGLGVTLYHALALRRPYVEESIPKILARIEGGKVEALRRVNPRLARDLETIVMKAMEAEPGRRYESAAAMAEDLERLVTLRPIRARPSGPVTRAFKLVRRNRGRVLGGVIGGALAVIVAAAFVVMVFLVPRWYEEHVREARLALLGEEFTNGVFVRTYGGLPDLRQARVTTELTGADLGRALDRYERAAGLPGRMRGADRLELEVVSAAKQLLTHPHAIPSLGAFLRERAPLTASFVERWVGEEDYPEVSEADLRGASAEDVRSLGLLALYVGPLDLTLRAWPLLDTGEADDPLVEAALGYMYLMAERPALAYPRLRSAATAFRDVGFVHACVADAAVRVGDYERAARILDAVERMERPDTVLGHRRIRMDLLAATGRDEEALALFDGFHGNPLASQRAASIWEHRGEAARAVRVVVSFSSPDDWRSARSQLRAGRMPRFRAFEACLVGVCERWWDGQGEADRLAFLGAAERADSYEAYVLERYAVARHRLATWPRRAALELAGGTVRRMDVELREAVWDEGVRIEALPLAGVCARLGVDGGAAERGGGGS